ncbi:hypothetical protein C2845_PM11G27960 [Panicum miliaceum]|uniref:Uncharacterized protein n=1 Tax=Panicum miliaceum TaxID=4540 RepID=A0A3L6RRC0_PANMI|nr:hypothetical protein C2845_PM11G27960 [Panicum miliaceum]
MTLSLNWCNQPSITMTLRTIEVSRTLEMESLMLPVFLATISSTISVNKMHIEENKGHVNFEVVNGECDVDGNFLIWRRLACLRI